MRASVHSNRKKGQIFYFAISICLAMVLFPTTDASAVFNEADFRAFCQANSNNLQAIIDRVKSEVSADPTAAVDIVRIAVESTEPEFARWIAAAAARLEPDQAAAIAAAVATLRPDQAVDIVYAVTAMAPDFADDISAAVIALFPELRGQILFAQAQAETLAASQAELSSMFSPVL